MSKSKRDPSLRSEIKKRLASGVPVENVFFECGFKCCIESVRDKGHFVLATLLEKEYKKIEPLGLLSSQGGKTLNPNPKQ